MRKEIEFSGGKTGCLQSHLLNTEEKNENMTGCVCDAFLFGQIDFMLPWRIPMKV